MKRTLKHKELRLELVSNQLQRRGVHTYTICVRVVCAALILTTGISSCRELSTKHTVGYRLLTIKGTVDNEAISSSTEQMQVIATNLHSMSSDTFSVDQNGQFELRLTILCTGVEKGGKSSLTADASQIEITVTDSIGTVRPRKTLNELLGYRSLTNNDLIQGVLVLLQSDETTGKTKTGTIASPFRRAECVATHRFSQHSECPE